MNRYGTLFRMLLAVACSLILAVVMTGSAAAETDVYLDVLFHSFTLDGTNDTCVDFVDSNVGPTKNCDPVNLVFPGPAILNVKLTREKRSKMGLHEPVICTQIGGELARERKESWICG